jgi:hypothetical protein
VNFSIDLNAIFQDGYSFEYVISSMQEKGMQTVNISLHEIGNLVVKSGKILACDPQFEPDLEYYFTQTVPLGQYPVILSVANFQPFNTTRVAGAMLRIQEKDAVRWELAAIHGQDPESEKGEICGFNVDSGTACFMDFIAADILSVIVDDSEKDEEEALKFINESELSFDDLSTLKSFSSFERNFCGRLIEQMDNNSIGMARWANLVVGEDMDANVIAFSSGWGDGGYSSVWGYDQKSEIVSLTTLFDLFA